MYVVCVHWYGMVQYIKFFLAKLRPVRHVVWSRSHSAIIFTTTAVCTAHRTSTSTESYLQVTLVTCASVTSTWSIRFCGPFVTTIYFSKAWTPIVVIPFPHGHVFFTRHTTPNHSHKFDFFFGSIQETDDAIFFNLNSFIKRTLRNTSDTINITLCTIGKKLN